MEAATRIDREGGSPGRLAGHLAPEQAGRALGRRLGQEAVGTGGFEVEGVEKGAWSFVVGGVGHGAAERNGPHRDGSIDARWARWGH